MKNNSNRGKYIDLSKNMFLFSISSFGQKFLAFILVPLYTNCLSTEEYGTVDLITTTISLLVPILTINIAEGVMRFSINSNESEEYLAYGIKVIVRASLIITVVLLFIQCLSFDYKIKYQCFWIYILFILNSVYSIIQNYLRATNRIHIMVFGGLINTFVMLISNIVLLLILHCGVNGYMIAMILGLVSSILFMELFSKFHRHCRVFIKCNKKIKGEMLAYCIPTVFTTLAWWVNSSIDRYFVVAICGLEKNGVYSVAYKIPTILGVFQTIFSQAWILSAVNEYDKEDKDGFFGHTYELYNSMMVLICACVMIGNLFLSKILYANEFFVAWRYVPILLISSLFSAMSGYLGGIFSAVKDTKLCAISTMISACVNIVLNFILIPKFSLHGAAIATMISYIVSWVIRIVASRKYIIMKINYRVEIIVYILLMIQMFFATQKNDSFVIQALLIVTMIIVNIKLYEDAIGQIIVKIRRK